MGSPKGAPVLPMVDVRVVCKSCENVLEGSDTLVCPSCHRAWDRMTSLRWSEVSA